MAPHGTGRLIWSSQCLKIATVLIVARLVFAQVHAEKVEFATFDGECNQFNILILAKRPWMSTSMVAC